MVGLKVSVGTDGWFEGAWTDSLQGCFRLKSRQEHGFLAQWREVADKINEDRAAENANPEPELDESVKAAWAPLLAPLEELRQV